MSESVKHTASKLFLSTANNATNQYIEKISNSRYIFRVEPYILHNDDPSHFVLGLEQASIPMAFYVFTTANQSFVINSVTYSIPVGNYVIEDLITTLNDITYLLITPIFEWTYSYTKNKISLRNLTASNYTITNFGTHKVSEQLGFASTGTSLPTVTTVEFPYCVNLTVTSGINIRMNNIITANKTAKGAGGGGSILARLPITSNSNTFLQYFNPVVFYLTLTSRVINFFDIELLDDKYQPLLFNMEDPNWFLVLKMDYIEKEAIRIDPTTIQQLRNASVQPDISSQSIPAPKPQNP